MQKNKLNILVTGGEGYIGSHLIKSFFSKLKPSPTLVSLDKKKGVNQKYINKEIFVKGDIRNTNLTLRILKKYCINIVIHLAGLIRTEASMRKPNLYFNNNVIGGLKLLEAMEKCGVKKIIFSSSAGVYGQPSKKIISENCQTNPMNFYGLTKISFEHLLQYYNRIHDFNYIIFRIFNVAGADPSGDLRENHKPETHLIPLVLRSIYFNRPVIIYGSNYNTSDGTCIRDYIHVNDVCQAFLTATPRLCSKKIGETFNLSSGRGHSVLEVINTCQKVLKNQIKIDWQDKRAGDPATLVGDCKKIKEVLKWEPKYKLEDMVGHAFNSFYKKTS